MLGVRSPYSRAPFYQGFRFDPSRDNVLSQVDDTQHAVLRAKLAAGVSSLTLKTVQANREQYAGKQNDRMEQTIDENISSLIKLIDASYISTATHYKPMDFGRKAQYLTLDVISNLAFGKAFGHLERDEDVHKYIEMLDEAGPSIILLAVLPLVRAFLRVLYRVPILRDILPNSKDKFGFGKVMG